MRPRTSILIPVKAIGRAKGRLAELLDQSARQELALTMLEDVLAAVMPAVGRLVDAVYVATLDPAVMEIARKRGARVLEEREQRSESASVDAASRSCASAATGSNPKRERPAAWCGPRSGICSGEERGDAETTASAEFPLAG